MSDRSRLRLFVLQALVISLLGTLLGRLWYLQVLVGGEYTRAAADNRIREVVTPAARGQILDALGRPLVGNRTALVVSVDRSVLERQPDKGIAEINRLSRVVGVPSQELLKRIQPCGGDVKPPCWNGSPYQPVPVKEDAAPSMALQIQEHREDFSGVTADFQAVRQYPQGALAAHSLGYLSPVSREELKKTSTSDLQASDLIGRSGLEQSYDARLRGKDGVRQVAVDHVGTVTGLISETVPASGSNLVLNLDSNIQKVAEEALTHAVANARSMYDKKSEQNYRADSAAAVVMDVRTGGVVALASTPSYDPSVFIGGISAADYAKLNDPAAGVPLLSRATQGQFSPGSTFKIVSTAAAVVDGNSLDNVYACPPEFKVGPQIFKNFEGETFGNITLQRALVKSCDTVFYDFGIKEWQRDEARIKAKQPPLEPMVRMAQAFGLGRSTGIDLPSESIGRIADRAYKKKFWDERKADYCAGANNPAFDALRRQGDQEFCLDGAKYRGGDAVNFAIGQGDSLVTPLQLATAYAALANGGTLYAPRLGKAVISPDGKTAAALPPVVTGQLPVPPDVLAYIRTALAGVPDRDGTAACAFGMAPMCGPPFPLNVLPIAGKTGTSEVGNKQDTSWFASFAPANNPRYAVVVMVSQGGQGGKVAAPATREIYDGIYGLEGRPAAAPGGQLPTALPCIAPDGQTTPPGTCVAPAPVPLPVPPSASGKAPSSGATTSALVLEATPPSRRPL
ncbi:MAG: penicillin-binding protein 2 [Mycobacteriales bacterium]